MTSDEALQQEILRVCARTGMSPQQVIEAAFSELSRRGQVAAIVRETGETAYIPRDPN